MAVARRAITRARHPLVTAALGAAASLLLLMVAAAGCSSDPERSVEAFCEQIRIVQGFDEVLASGDAKRINEQLDGLHNLERVAPDEIEPKVAILVGITDEVAHAVGTAQNRKVAADAVAERYERDPATIADASAAVANYSANMCNVRLGGSVPPASGRPGTTLSISSTTTTKR